MKNTNIAQARQSRAKRNDNDFTDGKQVPVMKKVGNYLINLNKHLG